MGPPMVPAMNSNRLLLLSVILAIAGPLCAAQDDVDLMGDGPAPKPVAAAPAPAPDDAEDPEAAAAQARRTQTQVAVLVRDGLAHVRRFNDDQARNATAIVDAAIAFGQARAMLPADAPPALVSDIQANLYWCKKQMNLAALKDYIARKGDDFALASQQMRAVTEAKVDPAQAPAYAQLAEGYAAANPGEHLQIAIRFTEIAERFPGTPQGTDANRRAAAALQAQMRAIQDAQLAARETRFTKPARTASGKTPLPGAQAQKDAQTLIRKSYAKAYAKREPAAKMRLARRLVDESAKNKNDPAVFHQMLSEAIRLAAESEAYEPLLDAIDQLAANFAGVDPQAEKQAALKRMSGKAVASAVLKLLAEPRDPAANLAVGKWYCFTAKRWDEGFRLLLLSGDPDMTRAVEMELAGPNGSAEELQLGDAWYDLAAKQKTKDERTSMQARAMHWYQESVDGLDGLSKDRVVKRIAEIDKLLPLDLENVDWANLTASQWDKLKGRMAAVNARVDRFDPQIALGAGDRFRVVPHPTDRWTITLDSWIGDGRKESCDWRGYTRERYVYYRGEGDYSLGALLVWVESGEKQNAGIISGPGRVWFAPHIVGWVTGDRTGTIRVKLVPVADDE